MEYKLLGTIFGVDIHSPYRSKEMQAVVNARKAYVGKLEEQGMSEPQVWDYVFAEFEKLKSNLTPDEWALFEEVYNHESNAHFSTSVFDCLTLYGVKVVYPFTRENVRQIAVAEVDQINNAEKEGLSTAQATNDALDELSTFYEKLDSGKLVQEFSDLWVIEMAAAHAQSNEKMLTESREEIKNLEKLESAAFGFSTAVQIIGLIVFLGLAYLLVSKL